MLSARPLPACLARRLRGRYASTCQECRAWHRRPASAGLLRRAMILSCRHRRVPVSSIFGADEGEFLTHRNLAGLVPEFNPDGNNLGNSAALEYGVSARASAQAVVLGQARYGGVRDAMFAHRRQAPPATTKDIAPCLPLSIPRPAGSDGGQCYR